MSKNKNRMNLREINNTKLILYKKSKGRCWYCDIHMELKGSHLDHIIPRCEEGSDHIDNLAIVCRKCNFAKGQYSIFGLMKWFCHIRSGNFKFLAPSLNNMIKEGFDDLEDEEKDKLEPSFFTRFNNL